MALWLFLLKRPPGIVTFNRNLLGQPLKFVLDQHGEGDIKGKGHLSSKPFYHNKGRIQLCMSDSVSSEASEINLGHSYDCTGHVSLPFI